MVAVALALFAGQNAGVVTVFWEHYRVDVSLNLFLLGISVVFVLLHGLWRLAAAMTHIPQQAKRWRLQRQERALMQHWLEAFSHQMGGRYIRARKAAELVLSLEAAVTRSGEHLPYAQRLRALSHWLAAESAHALQDSAMRQHHLGHALEHASERDAQDTRDGVLLRAALWSLDDKDAEQSARWLDQLPQGAARRTAALRLRFKVARMAGQAQQALELLRLLTKHRAFSEAASASIARGLAVELFQNAHDSVQMQHAWDALDAAQRDMPDVAMQAAQRWLALGGDAAQSRAWILPIWERMAQQPEALTTAQRMQLVRILEQGLLLPPVSAQDMDQQTAILDNAWLSRIESAQLANPRDAVLQYLAGMVCMRLGLWGKAQVLLRQAQSLLQDSAFKRDAWLALAALAQQREDNAAMDEANRQALHYAKRL